MHKARRRWGTGALVATALLALSGCMKVDMNMTLSEDDTMSGSFVMAFSDEVAELIGEDPEAFWEENKGSLSDLPTGFTEEPYAEDGFTGSRYTFEDQPLDDVGGGSADELTILREGDEYVVSGSMDLTDDTGELDGIPQSVIDAFEFRVAITFPGEITETSGEIEGTTAVWNLAFGEVTELTARGSAVAGGAADSPSPENTDDGEDATIGTGDEVDDGNTAAIDDATGGGFPFWIVGVAIVLVGVVGLVLYFVLRNKPAASYGGAQGYAPYQGQGPYDASPTPQYPGAPGGYAPGATYPEYPPQPGGYPQQYGAGQYPGAPTQPMPQAPGHPQANPTIPLPPQPGWDPSAQPPNDPRYGQPPQPGR